LKPDVLVYNSIGPAFTYDTAQCVSPGGSELETVQIAHALAKRGHRVVVANNVREESLSGGVLYVPCDDAVLHWPGKALVMIRHSKCSYLELSPPPRVVVRATDLACQEYDHLKGLPVVGVTQWQVDAFPKGEKIVINPILDPCPATERVPGRFFFGSGPMKGLHETLEAWIALRPRHPGLLQKTELVLVSPGWGNWPFAPGTEDKSIGVRFIGAPSPSEYRKWLASSEGIFFVNTHTETFCCIAAIAEREGVRNHILCKNGFGGIPEAVSNLNLITSDDALFENRFVEALRDRHNPKWYSTTVADRSAETLAVEWERALRL
jgi:hypothetical protein